jgi:hypothetical protein
MRTFAQVVRMILASIAAKDRTNLMLASHNQHSVELAIQTMNEFQMDAAVCAKPTSPSSCVC